MSQIEDTDPGPSPGVADPYVRAIHDAVAAGWGVVAAGTHVSTTYVAARAFGRLDDVLLVHARPAPDIHGYIGVEARRPPADWHVKKGVPHWSGALPVATRAEVTRPGALLLLMDLLLPYETGPAVAADLAASGGPPVLLVHAPPPHCGIGRQGAPPMVRLPADAPDPPPAGDGLARHAALASASVSPGRILLRAEGRTVLAQYLGDGGIDRMPPNPFLPPHMAGPGLVRPSRPKLRVAEADADGWVAFAEWRIHGMTPDDVEAHARHAWTHGTLQPPPTSRRRGCSTVLTGNLPWVPGGGDADHVESDADLAAVFGEVAVALQAYLADLAPARAVYRAARVGDAGRREQFLRAWPAFRTALLDPGVAAAVDAGARMGRILSGATGLPAPTVGRLAGRHRPSLWSALDARLGEGAGAAALGSLGHDRLPRRDDDGAWEAFDGITEEAFEAFDAMGLFTDAGPATARWVAAMLAGIPGRDWHARHDALQALGCEAPRSIMDMLMGLAGHLRGLGVPYVDPALAFRTFPGRPGYAGLISASIAWHADPILRLGSEGVDLDATWEVPFDRVDLGHGIEAVPLASMAELVAEGGDGLDGDGLPGLSHCVASYAPRCVAGQSLIVSFRRFGEGGRGRLSTAEFVSFRSPTVDAHFDRVEGRTHRDARSVPASLSLSQHRGRGNAGPPRDAVAALGSLLRGLSKGTIPWRGVGYGRIPDPADPATISRHALATHARWRRVLPGRLARLDPAGLAAHVREVAAAPR